MTDRRQPVRRKLGYLLLRLFMMVVAGLVRILPLSWLRRIATAFAYIVCVVVPSRQHLAQENIRLTFGDRFDERQRRHIARQATVNMCKTMMELLKMRYIGPQQLKQMVTLRGQEHLRTALEKGNGVILLTGHFGNWELGGARLAAEGFPIVVIARDANEQFTANLINQARQHHGERILAREDLREMLRVLRDNNCLAILPDQHTAVGGVVVDFLGRPAATPAGPATLALRTGCAIVPLFGLRRPDGTVDGYILPAVELVETGNRDHDIVENTRILNEILGEQIKRYPEQWLWLHRRWKV